MGFIDRVKLLLMDFDGVILDSNDIKHNAYQEMAADYPEDIQEKFIKYHLDNPGIFRYVKFRYLYEKLLNKDITETVLEDLTSAYSAIVYNQVLVVDEIDGVIDFLEKLYENAPIYIISGTPETELRKVVNVRHLDKYFNKVYGAPVSKFEHIENILKQEAADRNDTFFIGDGITDYRAAKDSGINFVGLLNKYNADEFKKLDDIILIKSFAELTDKSATKLIPLHLN